MGSPSLTKVAGRLGFESLYLCRFVVLDCWASGGGSLTPDGVAVNLSMFSALQAPLRRLLTLKMNRSAMF